MQQKRRCNVNFMLKNVALSWKMCNFALKLAWKSGKISTKIPWKSGRTMFLTP